MPIYEYRCQQCRAVTAVFVRAISSAGGDTATPACDQCGSADTQRMMSAFAMGKTVAGVHAANPLDGSTNSRDFYSDPRNIGRNVEQSFARHGVEMPASVRESIDAARSGAPPKGIDL